MLGFTCGLRAVSGITRYLKALYSSTCVLPHNTCLLLHQSYRSSAIEEGDIGFDCRSRFTSGCDDVSGVQQLGRRAEIGLLPLTEDQGGRVYVRGLHASVILPQGQQQRDHGRHWWSATSQTRSKSTTQSAAQSTTQSAAQSTTQHFAIPSRSLLHSRSASTVRPVPDSTQDVPILHSPPPSSSFPPPSSLSQDVSLSTELCPSLEVQLRCANSLQSLNWLSQHASHALTSQEAAAFVYGAARAFNGDQVKSRSKSSPTQSPPASTIKAVSFELMTLAETHSQSWDARCLGAFLTAATKLHLNPSLPWLQIISSELCADNGGKILQLCPSDLAHLCGACALSGFMGEDVWLTLRAVVLQQLPQFSTNSVSKTMWAFCSAKRWLSVPLLAALKEQFLKQVQDAQRRECSMALVSLAKIEHRDVAFCEALVRRLLAQKIHLTSDDVASTAYAVASLKYFNMDLFMCFADVLHNKVKMFRPAQLASLSWACARLEHHHTPLLETISQAALPLMPAFKCQDLASLSWSMVELGHDDPILFQAMAQQVESKMRSFNLVDLAMTAVAFSKLRTSTDDNYRHLVEQLAECTLPHIKKLHSAPFKASAVGIFGALARVHMYCPELLRELVSALCSQQLSMRDAATVLKSCVILRYVDDTLIQHISRLHASPEALAECRRSHGLRHLMSVLQLLVRLGCESKLQEVAQAWAGSQRTKLATHYRVTVAWCHCILGYKEISTLQRALTDLQRRPDVYNLMEPRNKRHLLHLRIKLEEALRESSPGTWITPQQAQRLLAVFPAGSLLQSEQTAWVDEQLRAKPRRLQLEVFQQLKRMGLQPLAQQPTTDQLFTVCVALKLNQHRIAVQALPVYCFARGPGKGRLMGLVQAELDSIAARGWVVRTVAYEDWVSLRSEDEKCQYLKRKLQLSEEEMGEPGPGHARHGGVSREKAWEGAIN